MKNEFIYRMHLALFFLDILRNPDLTLEKITKKLDFFTNSEESNKFIVTLYPYVAKNFRQERNIHYSATIMPERIDFVTYLNNEDLEKNKDIFVSGLLMISCMRVTPNIGQVKSRL